MAAGGSSLLALPNELRYHIIRCALWPASHQPDALGYTKTVVLESSPRTGVSCRRMSTFFSLALVCKTMHRDVCDILFSEGEFSMSYSRLHDDLGVWASRIGSRNCSLLRNLTLPVPQRLDSVDCRYGPYNSMTYTPRDELATYRATVLAFPRLSKVRLMIEWWHANGLRAFDSTLNDKAITEALTEKTIPFRQVPDRSADHWLLMSAQGALLPCEILEPSGRAIAILQSFQASLLNPNPLNAATRIECMATS